VYHGGLDDGGSNHVTTVFVTWPEVTTRNYSRIRRTLYDNFRQRLRRTFISAHPVCLQEIQVYFVYEGHPVEVKVTRVKKVDSSRNVKLRPAITPYKTLSSDVCVWMGHSTTAPSNVVTAIFVTWPEVKTR